MYILYIVYLFHFGCRAGREGQRGYNHNSYIVKKSDPDRQNRIDLIRNRQERSRSESHIHQVEYSRAVMNMKQEGPFLGKMVSYLTLWHGLINYIDAKQNVVI
jgi:hypothetical protein